MNINTNKTVAGIKIFDAPAAPLKELCEACRKISADGMVMLKNENSLLPLEKGEKIAVFGRIQNNYYKSGSGSGGMVNTASIPSVIETLRESGDFSINEKLAAVYEAFVKKHPFDNGTGWAQEPFCQTEMPLDNETVREAAEESGVAVIIIGRNSGEDHDNKDIKGSYRLNDTEEEMLRLVTAAFDKVVVLLNVGNIIDLSFTDRYPVTSLIYVWQGGMAGTYAIADVLSGRMPPAGKMPDTLAFNIGDYPSDKNFGSNDENIYQEDIYVGYRYFETFSKDSVRYPFGFGLTYTEFDIRYTAKAENGIIAVEAVVKNIGKRSGREVVQVYFEAPSGKLGTPSRQLAAYKKTGMLAPGKEEIITLHIPVSNMAAYDDGGYTGNCSCYVLEAGDYLLYAGTDVRSANPVFTYHINETEVTEKCEEALAPVTPFCRFSATDENGKRSLKMHETPLRMTDLTERIITRRPEEIPFTDDRGIKLIDVAENRATLDEFVAQLTADDIRIMMCGEGMCSPKVTGNASTAGAFGGVTEKLAGFGIPVVGVTDGPSGLRLDNGSAATLLPNGTLLASTFDDESVEQLYTLLGVEMFGYRIDGLLGPGMNIHRHPLNGRNFEYYSEDPLLSGKIGSAVTRGIAKTGCFATIKHFCCNNQEFGRDSADSIVSERALREIYLRPFEIAVKEGKATSVMIAYNPTNGFRCASNYDLTTTILRKEWGFNGFVMTDWHAKCNCEGEKACPENMKAMVRAGTDLYMIEADSEAKKNNIADGLDEGYITLGELQRGAVNLLRQIIASPTFMYFALGGCMLREFNTVDDGFDRILYEFNNVVALKHYPCKIIDSEICLTVYAFSAGDNLSQEPIILHFDNRALATFAITGSEGNEKKVMRRQLTVSTGNFDFNCHFNPSVTIEKITITAKSKN